jgi:cytochrome P450
MPQWSWLTGHIALLYAYTSKLPPLANVNLVFPQIAADFADTEMFLLDLWPVAESVLVVFNAEAAVEITQKMNFPKHPFTRVITGPITGGDSMLSLNGSQWKTWRALFNPGFSGAAIGEQTAHIVDLVQVFCEQLENASKKKLCFLDVLTSRLTFDVIMKVTL